MQIEDHLSRTRHLDLNEGDLARWETVGRRPVTPAVLLEVHDLHADPCLHRFSRAAAAARYAARVADKPLKTEAVALEEELERRSQ